MIIPDNYASTLYHYFDQKYSTYHYFKMLDGKPVVGTVDSIWDLIKVLKRFDEYDHYLSCYSFSETEPKSTYINGKKVVRESAQINKIFFDIDPEAGEEDNLDRIEELRAIPIPKRMFATGRGIQMFIDLDRNITLAEALYYQKALDKVFHIRSDTHVPIDPMRVFRLPYTKNSKNGRWCIPISDKLEADDIRTYQKYSSIYHAYFVQRTPVSVETLNTFIPPGTMEVKEPKIATKITLNEADKKKIMKLWKKVGGH